MSQFLPPSRPKRNAADLTAVMERYELNRDKASLIFIRGYYLDSLGKRGENDFNCYDDAAFLISPGGFESFNANTDPSFVIKKGKALAKLNPGKYEYYKGKHKGKYDALRPYPEGRAMPCTRNGVQSIAHATNIHKGGITPGSSGVTWSEGCLTIPPMQYLEFISRTYAAMTKCGQKTIEVVLIENRRSGKGQQLYDHTGRII